jgi:glycosyltransferase involved in cell wall biosynthesis
MSTATRPRISVVIVTRNRASDLSNCLASLAMQTLPPDELVIVDNASTDRTTDVVRSFRRTVSFPVRMVTASRTGFPVIYNVGLRAASHDWIAFIDDDCLAERQWMEHMAGAVRAHRRAAAILGRSLTADPQSLPALIVAFSVYLWHRGGVGDDGTIGDYAVLDNKNIVYNRTFLSGHGLAYDESMVAIANGAGEDADLGLQIAASGGTAFYDPTMIVRHKDPNTLTGVWRKLHSSALAFTRLDTRWNSCPGLRRRAARNTRSELMHFAGIYGLPPFRTFLLAAAVPIVFFFVNIDRLLQCATRMPKNPRVS